MKFIYKSRNSFTIHPILRTEIYYDCSFKLFRLNVSPITKYTDEQKSCLDVDKAIHIRNPPDIRFSCTAQDFSLFSLDVIAKDFLPYLKQHDVAANNEHHH